MTTERNYITHDEAIAMLPDGDSIHVFTNPYGGVLLGADWKRESVIDEIMAGKPELSGETASSMHHRVAIEKNNMLYFFETKK